MSGVTVNDLVVPWFAVIWPDGVIIPLAPAVAVMVKVGTDTEMVNAALDMSLPTGEPDKV